MMVGPVDDRRPEGGRACNTYNKPDFGRLCRKLWVLGHLGCLVWRGGNPDSPRGGDEGEVKGEDGGLASTTASFDALLPRSSGG